MIIIYELYGNHSDGVGECSFFYPGQHRGPLGSSFSGGVEKEEPKDSASLRQSCPAPHKISESITSFPA